MRANDILVSAFPKSGITYLGFLLLGARLKLNHIPLNPTFYNIDWLLIDTHKMERIAAPQPLWRDGLGEFYKSHSRREAVFDSHQGNTVYLLRNPVDTLKSYWHFRRQLKEERCGVMEFLSSPLGCQAWCDHVRSWLVAPKAASQSLYLIEYEALCRRPKQELNSLLVQLGWDLPQNTWDFQGVVTWAGLPNMRCLEMTFAGRNPIYAQYHLEFVRHNSSPDPVQARSVKEWTPEAADYVTAHCGDLYESVRVPESL